MGGMGYWAWLGVVTSVVLVLSAYGGLAIFPVLFIFVGLPFSVLLYCLFGKRD
jgi:hypothetical protein